MLLRFMLAILDFISDWYSLPANRVMNRSKDEMERRFNRLNHLRWEILDKLEKR